MHLETSILIDRTPTEVWTYLGDISNVPAWDRGVGSVQATSTSAPGVGFQFDTLGHTSSRDDDGSKARMSYRISDADPTRGCTVQLTSSDGNARFFKSAEWRFRIEPEGPRSKVFCAAHFQLRFPYILLAPVFYGMKRAIHADLVKLKQTLENPASTSPSPHAP